MSFLGDINIVTILIAGIFILPIVAGLLRPLTGDRIHSSFVSFLSNIMLLVSVILSLYLTRTLLLNTDSAVMQALFGIFPALRSAVDAKSVWVFVAFIGVILLAVDGLLYLITKPIYSLIVVPLSEKMSAAVDSMGSFFRRIVSGFWQLPKSIWLVLIFSMLLNFYTGVFNDSFITQYADDSVPFQYVQANVLQPLLKSSVVKDIQVLFNDSFHKISDSAGNKYLIKYFNGMPLEDAILSNSTIDATARQIVGAETNDKKKGYLIYRWICKNIGYDYAKAERISKDPFGVSSGAIVAYEQHSGICFDYACLYIAMCRAVDLKVRFVTGLGYSGTTWGDHAWNQIYTAENAAWVNVDTTFGSSGINYFDRPSFSLDHSDGVVQGEW